MIKKIGFILFFFLFSSVVFGNDVSIFVRAGKNAYKYDETNTRKIPIKEGTVFEIEGFGMDKYKDISYENFGDERDWYYSYFSKRMPILYTNNFDSICIENLFPKQSDSFFPEKYISYGTDESKKIYINIESINALFENKKEIIKSAGVNNFFNENDYNLVAEYLKGNMESYPVFSNVVITFFTLENLLISNIKKIDINSYEVDCLFGGDRNFSFEVENDCHSVWLFKDYYYRSDRKDDYIKIKVLFDGDYVMFFDIEQNKLLTTHVLVDKTLALKCADFFQGKKVNYTDIEWPRHSDGSCDYDGSKTTVASQTTKATSSTNVAPNKTMLVNENLKLRSGEDTSTQVLSVMSAGTKVKILELGKAETIDGISSNWVKVEVQKGAKDRDGNPIKPGTVGWCFGGFLE